MGDTTAHSGILALTKSTLSPQNKYDHKRRQKTFDDSLSTVHTCSGDICGSLQLKQQRFQRRQDLQHQHPSPCSSSDRESTVIYAGPHFMNDAPSPSSLPLPKARSKQHPQRYGFYSSYRNNPIFEIQDRLHTLLKIKV